MKKLLAAFLIVAGLSSVIVKADTTTSRFGLTKPDVGSTNWGPKINTNYDTIDNAAGLSLVNTFTSSNTFNAATGFAAATFNSNGTSSAPSWTFTSDPVTGWYRSGSGIIGFTSAGTASALFTPNDIQSVSGSNSTPSFSFINDSNTGMYNVSSDQLGFSAGGVLVAISSSSGAMSYGPNPDITTGGWSYISAAAGDLRQLLYKNNSSGNPFTNWSTSVDNFSAGIVNSSRFWALTNTNSMGSGYTVKVSTGGFMTRPLQPYFHVRFTGNATSVTGDGTQYTVTWPTEITDNGNNFAQVNSTYCFTAPITGIYSFHAKVDFGSLGVAHTTYRIDLVTTNQTYTTYVDGSVNTATDRGVDVDAPVASMTAGNIAYITVKVSNGAKTVNVGSGSGDINYFMGSLIN